MSTNAFTPLGNTSSFTASTTAPTPVQVAPYSTIAGANQYRIINTGTVVVFLGIGISSAAANTAATSTMPGPASPLLPGTDEILTFAPNAYFTGVTTSGTAQVYISPGDGM